MNEFSIGGAWSLGFRFVARGTAVHFLILVLVGMAAPLGLQYAIIGAPFDASPMSGQAMLMSVGAPLTILIIALAHVLQIGSYFGALRFGFTDAQAPAGAIGYGLAAGCVATLVIAIGYAVAFFGVPAAASAGSIELGIIILMLPLFLVYSLFLISVAIMAAATILLLLAYLFVIGLLNGYPGAVTLAFGSGGAVVIMLLLSGLLFWLAARFSCVTAIMAQRGSPNVFEAIGESWRMTSDEQWPITRYLALIGFGLALVVIAISLAVGAGTGGLAGGNLGLSNAGDLVLRLLFGIPLAFLSVILPAGIYQQLTGEETSAEVFD